MRESVYATLTGLTIVGVLLFGSDATVGEAFSSLILGISGIALAGFVAELVAFQISHSRPPDRPELLAMARTALGALGSASIPLAAIAMAALGWISIMLALQLSVGIYFATLIVMLLLAARRTRLGWRQQLVSLVLLLGLAVTVLVTLAIVHHH